MKSTSHIVLKLLAMLLLTAAFPNAWQLLTEPVPNNDLRSYRPFLVLTVAFQFALAVWLLSGLFKKAVWLATLACFSLFSGIKFWQITSREKIVYPHPFRRTVNKGYSSNDFQ